MERRNSYPSPSELCWRGTIGVNVALSTTPAVLYGWVSCVLWFTVPKAAESSSTRSTEMLLKSLNMKLTFSDTRAVFVLGLGLTLDCGAPRMLADVIRWRLVYTAFSIILPRNGILEMGWQLERS